MEEIGILFCLDCIGNVADTMSGTESIAQRTIALPFHNNLTEAQVARVVAALQDVV
jgi:dTDP-4-amino-4,6-dideoxygalactose transaminase